MSLEQGDDTEGGAVQSSRGVAMVPLSWVQMGSKADLCIGSEGRAFGGAPMAGGDERMSIGCAYGRSSGDWGTPRCGEMVQVARMRLG